MLASVHGTAACISYFAHRLSVVAVVRTVRALPLNKFGTRPET